MSDVTTLPTPKRQSKQPPMPPQDPPTGAIEAPFVASHPSRYKTSSEFEAPRVWYCAQAGTPFQHVLRPEYWASLSPRMVRARSEIVVEVDDSKWRALLYVDKVGQGWAKVFVLQFWDLVALRGDQPADPAALPTGLRVEYTGPIGKWRVVRLSDSHVLKSEIATEEAAHEWARTHQRVISN